MNQNFRSKKDFARLLEKYLQGRCTPQEEKYVLEWYEAMDNDSSSTFGDEELDLVEARIEANIKFKLNNSSERNKKAKQIFLKDHIKWNVSSIAAAVIFLVLSIGLIYQFSLRKEGELMKDQVSADNTTSVIRNSGKVAKLVKLDDGTVITLQPLSSITFTHPFASDKREVTLTGEGFFEVKRDVNRPFLVYTEKVVTRVLGTSFNIKSHNSKDIVVAVKTGKVSVSKQESVFLGLGKSLKDEVILTPNEQAVYSSKEDKIKTSLVEIPEIVAAQQDFKIMKFDNAPLSRIFEDLAKAYQVEIVFNERQLEECTLTTTLNKENLFDRLNIICKATGGSYVMEGTKIIIHNDGCN